MCRGKADFGVASNAGSRRIRVMKRFRYSVAGSALRVSKVSSREMQSRVLQRLAPRCGLVLMLAAGLSALGAEVPVLVPQPREVKWSAETPAKLASGTVAIVLGRQATAPEQTAARL